MAKKKTKARTVKPSGRQIGVRKDIKRDRKLKALRPGKRISKNNKVYYENRRNRSDLKGKRI